MNGDRQVHLMRAFVSLADTLVRDHDVLELLQQLVDHCVDLLDIPAAGLLLADAAGTLRVAAASGDTIRALEQFQVQVDDGPCLECFATRRRVFVTDPGETSRRWPRFAPAMAADGYVSVAAVPLRRRMQGVGVMGLFSDRVLPEGSIDVEIAQGLADVATIGILQARLIHDSQAVGLQLQAALDSRVVVEQAKGVVATQAGTSVAEAFHLIRTHARGHGLRLAEVAHAVVNGEITASDLTRTPSGAGPIGPARKP